MGRPKPHAGCGGPIQTVYVRKGEPTRWVRLGLMCLACYSFWPDEAG